jgi:hypothetical protein
MSKYFSPTVFGFVGVITYALAVTYNWPAFAYYPLIKQFSWTHDLPKASGPAMLYYGWMATTLIPALILAFAVPGALSRKLPAALGWIVPALGVIYMFIYCAHWFTS